jgi:gluconolactonase
MTPIEMDVTTVATGLRFPEGPVAMDDGSVLLVEIAERSLSRVAADGTVERLVDCGGGPNGAAIGPDGGVYLCNNGEAFGFSDLAGFTVPGDPPESWRPGCIQRVDLETRELTTLYTHCDGRDLIAPNDLVFDGHGGFYFTDFGLRRGRTADRTGVYYALADGSSIREVVFPLDSPNGVGLSPDGSRLYVAETYSGRLWSWSVTGPGEVASHTGLHAGAELHYAAPGVTMFDSLAVDAEGWVCVGTLGLGVSGITAVSPDGQQVELHRVPDDPLVTNICFGGEGHRTAWITSSGSGRLLRAEWPRPGLRLPHS